VKKAGVVGEGGLELLLKIIIFCFFYGGADGHTRDIRYGEFDDEENFFVLMMEDDIGAKKLVIYITEVGVDLLEEGGRRDITNYFVRVLIWRRRGGRKEVTESGDDVIENGVMTPSVSTLVKGGRAVV
jgi:hypothetical protein